MTQFRFLFTTAHYDNTVAFYADTMGLPVLRSWDDNGRGTILTAAGSGQIEIFEGDDTTEPPRGVALAWEVDDVDAQYDRLRAAGVEFDTPPTLQPWGYRTITLTAPENLSITLFTTGDDES